MEDHNDANVAELLLQHLFGLGTDADKRHVHEHSKVLPKSMFVHTAAAEFPWTPNDCESGSSRRLWPNRAPHAQ